MEAERQLQELLDLAESMQIEVRFTSLGGQPGGLCRLRGRWLLCINEDEAVEDQVDTIVAALAERPELEDRFILPEIRVLLENRRGR